MKKSELRQAYAELYQYLRGNKVDSVMHNYKAALEACRRISEVQAIWAEYERFLLKCLAELPSVGGWLDDLIERCDIRISELKAVQLTLFSGGWCISGVVP